MAQRQRGAVARSRNLREGREGIAGARRARAHSEGAEIRAKEVEGRARQKEDRGEEDRSQANAGAEAGRGRRREGRLAGRERIDALLRPWWVRDPGLLRVEIDGLRHQGFRVRQSVRPDGRITLSARQAERQYEIRYPHAFPEALPVVGDGTLSDPEDRIVTPEGAPPLGALGIDQLERDQPNGYQRLAMQFNVLFPLLWSKPPEGTGGTLRLGAGSGPTLAVLGLTGSTDAGPQRAPSMEFEAAFPRSLYGWWATGPAPDWSNDDETIVREIETLIARSRGVPVARVRLELRFGVGALAYPITRGGHATQWLFARRTFTGDPELGRIELWRPRPDVPRSPFSGQLRNKRVSVIGCGALGWGIALSLARAGVGGFALFDGDFVRASNLPRLAARVSHVGERKVDALAAEIHDIAPGAGVTRIGAYVGRTLGARGLMNPETDLFIDASADSQSPGETNLAAVALDRPAIFAWTSNGVLAARIFRVVPGRTACYACVREAEPPPLRSARTVDGWPEEFVWNGANFNLEVIASATARMAVRTLVGHAPGRDNPDHVVLEIAGALPRVRHLDLERRMDCEVCS